MKLYKKSDIGRSIILWIIILLIALLAISYIYWDFGKLIALHLGSVLK